MQYVYTEDKKKKKNWCIIKFDNFISKANDTCMNSLMVI